ncbi:MAG: hypothetical protein R3E01_18185 [Pirellulaceae bacterium]|nr:hypothetical protein [Planctomycetales bacterium]
MRLKQRGTLAERPRLQGAIAVDVSWNDIGCYDNPAARTPNIDSVTGQRIQGDRVMGSPPGTDRHADRINAAGPR